MLNFKDWLAKENTDLTSVLKGTIVTLMGKDPSKASAPKIATQVIKDPNVKKASDASEDPVAIDSKKLGNYVQGEIKKAAEQQRKDAQKSTMAVNP